MVFLLETFKIHSPFLHVKKNRPWFLWQKDKIVTVVGSSHSTSLLKHSKAEQLNSDLAEIVYESCGGKVALILNEPSTPDSRHTKKTHLLSKDILKKASQGPTAKEDPSLSLSGANKDAKSCRCSTWTKMNWKLLLLELLKQERAPNNKDISLRVPCGVAKR